MFVERDEADDDATADANSEGGMNLTPVLKALGARSSASNPTVATSADLAAADTKTTQASTSLAAKEDTVRASADDLQSRSGKPPVESAEEFEAQTIGNVSFKSLEGEDLETKEDKSRTVVLKNLPDDCDYTLVQSVVYGAAIESMKLDSKSNTAAVKVTTHGDCQLYVDSSSAGLRIKHNRVQHTVLVERSPDQDITDNTLQAYLDCGATRVVKTEDVDEEMKIKAIYDFANGPSQSRQVEMILDSCRRGLRNIVFRFSGIRDAVAFRSVLLKDRNWKGTNPQFAADPCESVTGIRYE